MTTILAKMQRLNRNKSDISFNSDILINHEDFFLLVDKLHGFEKKRKKRNRRNHAFKGKKACLLDPASQ